jgi:hypothetical protein
MLKNCVGVKGGNRPLAGKVEEMEAKELEKALKFEQAKVKLLVNEVIGLEDEIVNRMLGDFGNVVNADSREYWRGQLLENRAEASKALATMAGLVGGGKPAGSGPSVAGSVRQPLHNRALSRPAPRSATGEAAQGAAEAKTAGLVRNRAQEIARAERIPFTVAFRRAEREVRGQ